MKRKKLLIIALAASLMIGPNVLSAIALLPESAPIAIRLLASAAGIAGAAGTACKVYAGRPKQVCA